jgi:hypothetical protein
MRSSEWQSRADIGTEALMRCFYKDLLDMMLLSKPVQQYVRGDRVVAHQLVNEPAKWVDQ